MKFPVYSDTENDFFKVSMVSSGHIFAESGRRIERPTGRDDWLLLYIARGNETFFLEREMTAVAGAFILFKPHEKQMHFNRQNATAEFYYVHFRSTDENFCEMFGFVTSRVYPVPPSPAVCELFESLLSEMKGKLSNYEKLCTLKLYEILFSLQRMVYGGGERGKPEADRVFSVIQKMNTEYASDTSLSDYAAACGFSKYYFSRLFKKITGRTPMEYRNEIRLEHAKEMLEDSRYSVREIADKTGFSSSSYFCDAFKKRFGISPAGYRETHLR